ncbi:MAG: hypothetical protein WC375_11825 [Methanomassiliicoccales archaeon]|jgi:hypothetical protein
MAKFYGEIGYAETTETVPGVWTETVVERNYSGDVIKSNVKWQSGPNLNDNLVINNAISIVADPFAYQNFSAMRYVKWMGVCWKITNVEVQRPRLILAIGGVYNAEPS